MTLVGNTLYIANTDAIVAFPYSRGATRISASGQKIADLPAGPINHHWTKDVIASRDGKRLFATVGSNSNVGEKGVEAEIRGSVQLFLDPAIGLLYRDGVDPIRVDLPQGQASVHKQTHKCIYCSKARNGCYARHLVCLLMALFPAWISAATLA